jgi:O-antigen/teichoic acid export membrane protein
MAHLAPREIARDFLYLSGARLFSLGVSFVRSLFIPRLLGPASYGMWKSFGIIQSYIQFSDLGALAALKREIPLLSSRGEEARLREARDVAFLVNNVVVLLAAVAVMTGSLLVPDPLYGRALRLFVLLLYATHLNVFLEKLLFWRKDFAYASRLTLILSLVEAVLAVGGTILYGLDGLIVGTFIGYGLVVLLQLRRIGFQIGFAFRWATYKELVKIGFPSHVNGLLYNILTSIDRVLILPVLGLEGLGLYGLAMTINEYLFRVSYAFGNVLSPRLVEKWSEEGSVAALRPLIEKPTLAIAVAAPAVLGTVYFTVAPVVEVVLPDFQGAVLPLRILLVGTYFSSLHRGLSSFFLTIRKQARLFPVYGGAIAANAGLVWMALDRGHGISGVAGAASSVMALFSFTLIVMARQFFSQGFWDQIRFLALLLAPLAWAAFATVAGTVVGGMEILDGGPFAAALAGLATFASMYAPAIYLGYRRLRPRAVTA